MRFRARQVRQALFFFPCIWLRLVRIVSITLGRPLAICSDDIDVKLPEVSIGRPASSEAAMDNDDQDMLQSDQNSRTVIFVHIVRYRDLCGRFLTSLHRSSRSTAHAGFELRKTRDEFALELEAWRTDTTSLRLPELDLSSLIAEARSSFRSNAWYELLYHNAILLLYRPTPNVSLLDALGDIPRLLSSAEQAIKLYSYLFRSRKINFSWVVLHAVFMAGLTYVYAVSRHIREKRKDSHNTPIPAGLQQDPTVVEIANTCRACSQVLVAASERCNAQKNCYEVFDRLSDAVLADAVDLVAGKFTQPSQDAEAGTHRSALNLARNTFNAGAPPTPSTSYTTDTHGSNANQRMASDKSQQHSSLMGDGMQQPYTECTFGVPPLATDNALRDCFPGLRQIYDAQWGDDAILHLSMDWLGDIDPNISFD